MKFFGCSHLKAVNETYFEHMYYAAKYGFKMFYAGIACLIHAIFPSLFVTTASKTLHSIMDEIKQRHQKPDQ